MGYGYRLLAEGVSAKTVFLLSFTLYFVAGCSQRRLKTVLWLWQGKTKWRGTNFSQSKISTLPTGIYSDGDGLFLRVRKGGSRQWLFIYRRGVKRIEIGLGGYGRGTAPVSLTLARKKAEAIRERLALGVDPRGEVAAKRQPPRVVTFKRCMDDLLRGEGSNGETLSTARSGKSPFGSMRSRYTIWLSLISPLGT